MNDEIHGVKPPCQVPGCQRPSRRAARQLCAAHEKRLRLYGDVNYVTPRDVWLKACREAQTKPAKETTYRKLYGRHAHRVVAEEMLGRPLQRNEIVHHIDGNKHNNDPSNLQVMSQADHLRLHHAEMWKARKRKYGYAD